jgi:hemoglobin
LRFESEIEDSDMTLLNTPWALRVALCAALCFGAAPALAQSPTAAFEAFGGKPGLVKLMDDFMQRLVTDERMKPHFAPTNQARVKEQLVDQFCSVLGGPCTYKGADMKAAHQNLDINMGDFNRLVEVLQASMAAQGVPFSAQGVLLNKLAFMHRDVVTTK